MQNTVIASKLRWGGGYRYYKNGDWNKFKWNLISR